MMMNSWGDIATIVVLACSAASCTNQIRTSVPPGETGGGAKKQGSNTGDGGAAEPANPSNPPTGQSGQTGTTISSEERLLNPSKWLCCKYPFPTQPLLDFTIEAREFGAPRAGGARKHAGVDLVYDQGTTMYAIGDGVVLDVYEFYQGTWAMEVKHRDFIARYGEISPSGPIFKPGFYTRQWQRLAFVGSIEMLHLELYSGKATGPLSNWDNPPFLRRSDLMDPMNLVKTWKAATLGK
jgi:hypothetical protein